MRICLVYDHLYPATIGGGEKWMHDLALRLAAAGHAVTYLTMTHWETEPPELAGVRVVGLNRAGTVYDAEKRTLGPPLRFGFAVFRHLLRHGREYDVVHTAAFPYFPLLAAGVLRRARGYQIVVDWYEVWSRAYWRRYAGMVVGTIGWSIQRACTKLRQHAFCISRLTERRLREEGYRGTAEVLPGLYDGPVTPSPHGKVEPLIVFAGRQIPEKRIPLLIRGFAEARRTIPTLRLEIYGDGSDRPAIEQAVIDVDLPDAVLIQGRRSQLEVADAMGRATCLATASEREGYGLIVVEAAARGTPSVVVAGDENAAVDLIESGVNGIVAEAPTPAALGAAIVQVVREGDRLRASTEAWFARRADTLQMHRSLELVERVYAQLG